MLQGEAAQGVDFSARSMRRDAQLVEFVCGLSVMLGDEAYSIQRKIPSANLPEFHYSNRQRLIVETAVIAGKYY